MHALGPNFDRASTGEYESDNLVGDNLSHCPVQHQNNLGVNVSSDGSGSDNNSVVIKKLVHKANARNRSKKTNSLFSSLRSCLPGPDEPYIPELKEEVKKLIQKKEDLLERVSGQKERYFTPQAKVVTSYVSTVMATSLTGNEVTVQISSSKIHNFSIHNVLSGLEEDGFVLVDVSSSNPQGERLFYTLHLQVDKIDNYKLICEELGRRVLYLYEQCGN